MNIPATPPTGWFNFFVDGGLAAVFFVLTVILTLLARELAKRLDAMYEKRLVEQKQCEAEKVGLLNKVLETQHQTSIAIRDNVTLLTALKERMPPRV